MARLLFGTSPQRNFFMVNAFRQQNNTHMVAARFMSTPAEQDEVVAELDEVLEEVADAEFNPIETLAKAEAKKGPKSFKTFGRDGKFVEAKPITFKKTAKNEAEAAKSSLFGDK